MPNYGFQSNGRFRPSIAGAVGDVFTTSLGGAGVSRQFARRIDVASNAFQVRLYNADSVSHANVKAIISVIPVGGDPYGSTAVWTNVTFSGSTTVTIPAGSGTIPNHTFGTVDSDLIYLTADVNQMVIIRVYDPSANATRFEHPTLSPNMTNNGLQSAFWTGDGVTTPSSFVPTFTNTAPGANILTFQAQPARLWLVGGASTSAGQGDTVQLGWARRTETLLQAANNPWGCLNVANSGSGTAFSLPRLLSAIQFVKPSLVSWQPFTTNDPGLTLADIPRLKGQALRLLDACAAVNATPVLITFQPNAVATGDVLTIMQTINQYCRDLAAQGLCYCLDFQLLFSGTTTGTTWADPGDTTDGTHPNAQGHAKAAAFAYSTLFNAV